MLEKTLIQLSMGMLTVMLEILTSLFSCQIVWSTYYLWREWAIAKSPALEQIFRYALLVNGIGTAFFSTHNHHLRKEKPEKCFIIDQKHWWVSGSNPRRGERNKCFILFRRHGLSIARSLRCVRNKSWGFYSVLPIFWRGKTMKIHKHRSWQTPWIFPGHRIHWP